jgi:hypothetical protein
MVHFCDKKKENYLCVMQVMLGTLIYSHWTETDTVVLWSHMLTSGQLRVRRLELAVKVLCYMYYHRRFLTHETLLRNQEGLAMIDDGHIDARRRYWFPCVTLSSDATAVSEGRS